MNLRDIFLGDDRWLFLWHGLEITLLITVFASILGLVLGLIITVLRQLSKRSFGQAKPVRWFSLRGILGYIMKLYVSIVRGTPQLVQLLIFYYVIFGSTPSMPKLWIAVLAFGFNSAAYISEILRGGVESIDKGQTEAARSLGFNYGQTLSYVIFPQVFRNSLPSLINELVTLLKDTSIVGWIGMNDLMRGADNIRFQTGTAFQSLFAVAIIYLILTSLFTRLTGKLERNLHVSD